MIHHAPTIARALFAIVPIIALASLWQSARVFGPAWRRCRDDLAKLQREGGRDHGNP